MSLGWQCESALLPSKSKPINVDAKSIVGLKALLYNEEQNKATNGSFNRQHRKAKRPDVNNNSAGKLALPPAAENISETDKEAHAYRSLQAKAKLYEEIANGKSVLQSDVVDFTDKLLGVEAPRHSDSKEDTAHQLNIPPPPKPPTLKNPFAGNSNKYGPYSTNTLCDVAYSAASTPSTSTSSQPVVVSTAPQWNWSTTYVTSKSSSDEAYARNVGSSPSSSVTATTFATGSQSAAERELKRAVAQRVEIEEKSCLATVSDGARVKTQWEKTLNSSARSYLDEIHDEVAVQREVSGALGSAESAGITKRTSREEKLEMIRRKRLRL